MKGVILAGGLGTRLFPGYIEKNQMTWDILEGWWNDAGMFQFLLHANQLVARTGANKI